MGKFLSFLIVILVTWLVAGSIFSYFFANWLTVKVEFFRKGYRRAIITRFLWEKGYFYSISNFLSACFVFG